MVDDTLLQLGTVAVLFLIGIKEFFSYLKSRKECMPSNDFNDAILKELQMMNTNHLHSIEKAITDGNARLIESIHNDNIMMIEALGRINGKLSK